MRLLVRWVLLAVSIALTAWLLPNVTIHGGVFAVLWVALLFGLVNMLIGTVLRLLTLPLTILTLGLFALVINALMVEITSHITKHFDVNGFWAAFWAAILISVFGAGLNLLVPDRLDGD
jgi:putative membrane protein